MPVLPPLVVSHYLTTLPPAPAAFEMVTGGGDGRSVTPDGRPSTTGRGTSTSYEMVPTENGHRRTPTLDRTTSGPPVWSGVRTPGVTNILLLYMGCVDLLL